MRRIRPRPIPAEAYFDERPANLDNTTRDLAFALGSFGITRIQEWITRGQGGPRQRGLRSDLVTLCVCPQMLPCKRPSAGWCAREHGVSRQYAYRLQQEFSRELADYIRFRGQRFQTLREELQRKRQ